MGLDMYLTGRRTYYGAAQPTDEEGYKVESVGVELGYWRKHADLHGYIVATFAEGEDNCQEIELGVEDIRKLLAACEDPLHHMPKTEGFFFGRSAARFSDEERAQMNTHEAEVKAQAELKDQIKYDREVWGRALAYLTGGMLRDSNWEKRAGGQYGSVHRSVIYRASW